MTQIFKATADIVEVNEYTFTIEAETKEEAEAKLKEFLKGNAPYPSQPEPFNGIQCTDRTAGMETRETESITITIE